MSIEWLTDWLVGGNQMSVLSSEIINWLLLQDSHLLIHRWIMIWDDKFTLNIQKAWSIEDFIYRRFTQSLLMTISEFPIHFQLKYFFLEVTYTIALFDASIASICGNFSFFFLAISNSFTLLFNNRKTALKLNYFFFLVGL